MCRAPSTGRTTRARDPVTLGQLWTAYQVTRSKTGRSPTTNVLIHVVDGPLRDESVLISAKEYGRISAGGDSGPWIYRFSENDRPAELRYWYHQGAGAEYLSIRPRGR